MLKPPERMDRRGILWKTIYGVMGSYERSKVFEAYDYNSQKQIYELKRPELLTEDIIKKLI